MNLMQALSDPQSFALQILASNPKLKSNPMISNAIQMAQENNEQGLRDLANNLAQNKGIDLNPITSKFNALK